MWQLKNCEVAKSVKPAKKIAGALRTRKLCVVLKSIL